MKKSTQRERERLELVDLRAQVSDLRQASREGRANARVRRLWTQSIARRLARLAGRDERGPIEHATIDRG